jgi:hypothetical protein
MRHPLAQRVDAVRRRAVRLVRAHALAWWVAALLAIVLVLAGADYVLRLQDAGARWIITFLGLAAASVAAWKLLGPAMEYRLSLVQVAHRIEKVFPQLGQRLSSAMDFMAQDEADKSAGSADLRRAVVAEAEAASVALDFRQAIDSRRTVQALAAALVALLIGGAMFWASERAANLALARLAMPWRNDLAWPREHTLQFLKQPDKLAAGDDFEVELVDRLGRLPDAVRMQLRFETPTGTRTESREMKPLADRMIFRLDNVTQSFEYRATGGDDDSMPWTRLAVIEPPKVVNLLVALQPPAYTGLPRQSAGRVVKAMAGSELVLGGRMDKAIVSARLRSESPGVPLPDVAITSDGLTFVVPADQKQPWRMDKSATYWVELADASGLPTGRDTRVEVQVQADSPPAISWELPGESTHVTPRAVVPVRALVKDDLAIARIELRYLRPGHSDQGEQVVNLYAGPPQAQPAGGMEAGDSRSIDTGWDLSLLAGLAPGDVLAVRLTAEDYQPRQATSVARRLTIITEDELAGRIGQRQTSILGQMAEALRTQRQCREQLGALLIRLEEKRRLDASHLNQLQSAQLNQRQVEKLLGPGSDGVEGQIETLLAELAANRVERQALADRMNDLLASVRTLNREPLVEISRQLTEASKTAREGLDGGREAAGGDAAPALSTAAARQDEVIATLESLLGKLTEWDSFSRLAREIGQIRGEEERLVGHVETLRLAAVAGQSLAAAERATAREQRQSQLELARRLDKIQGRMEQMLARLAASDPIAAGTLADALDAGRRLAIGGQMRAAADRLGQFQFGEAMQHQQSVLAGLAELLSLLSSRREDELARTIKSLRAAAGDLAALARAQGTVQGELDAAAAETDMAEQRRRVQRLARELEKLSQEAQELSRRLQRLRAPQAATPTGQAGEQSAAAGQSAGQGDADRAQEQSRHAQRRLEDAQQQLRQAIAEAEQELVQQQLARMEQWIGGLLARQKNVVAEIGRIDASREATDGELPAAMLDALKQVTAEQRLIADETEQLEQKIAEMPAFVFALEGARAEMVRAADMLARGQTGQPPQQAAAAAATRLQQLLSALEPDTATPPPDPPPDGQTPPTPPAGQQDPFRSLAALKLLQLLQVEISRRTAELEKGRAGGGELTDEQKEQLEALAAEQGRLADMVLNLIRESAAAPEDQIELPPKNRSEPE